MNRILCCLLIIALAISLCACGTGKADASGAKISEPFELRDGILFGDTIDEVKEKVDGLTFVEERESYIEDLKTKEREDRPVLIYSGIISGSECEIRFYFDQEGALTDLDYRFAPNSDTDATKLYSLIKETCEKKYGKPLDLDDGQVFVITGQAVYHALRDYSTSSDLVDYDEWVLYGEDGNNVKIDETIFDHYYKGFFGENMIKYYVAVSYHYFSQSELETIQNRKKVDAIEKATEEIKNQMEADAVF